MMCQLWRIGTIVMLAAGLFCHPLLASQSSPSPSPKNKSDPCRVIIQACLEAGFVKYKNSKSGCMKPLLAGESVPGVNAPPDLVEACKAARARNPIHSP